MVRSSDNRRMNVKTQNEISLLADQELDAVVGGRRNLPLVGQGGGGLGRAFWGDPGATLIVNTAFWGALLTFALTV